MRRVPSSGAQVKAVLRRFWLARVPPSDHDLAAAVGGATPLEAQRAARHASLDMTYLYTLRDTERETSQRRAMSDWLMEVDGGKPQ